MELDSGNSLVLIVLFRAAQFFRQYSETKRRCLRRLLVVTEPASPVCLETAYAPDEMIARETVRTSGHPWKNAS